MDIVSAHVLETLFPVWSEAFELFFLEQALHPAPCRRDRGADLLICPHFLHLNSISVLQVILLIFQPSHLLHDTFPTLI